MGTFSSLSKTFGQISPNTQPNAAALCSQTRIRRGRAVLRVIIGIRTRLEKKCEISMRALRPCPLILRAETSMTRVSVLTNRSGGT